MSEANKAVVRRVYEGICSGDLTVFDAVVAANVVEHEELPGLEQSREGVREFFRLMRVAFPDLAIAVEDLAAEGDKVFVRATMSGTHRGTFMDMPATGKTIRVPVADFFRLEDGLVVEHWGVTDTGVMLHQLQG